MLFNSFQYLLFLPLTVLLFWTLPVRWRLPMLLVASYIFYASWIPAFVLLIGALTVFTWLWGKALYAAAPEKKKLFLGIGIAVNLLTLGTFKYANFAVSSLAGLVHMATRQTADWSVNIILPLGISFFVFEFIHYLFEIYRGNKPIDSFVLFALFAAFFPTQISGPIKRYPDFQAQMLEEKPLRLTYFDDGLSLILIGLAKKLLLADNLAVLVQMGLASPFSYGALELWLFAYAFAFQIYFDFSGYTDIARGSAMLFGYHIPTNFNMPYIAQNMADFWHRWHISLSTWLRDYLFIPMGGSRGSKWRTYRNLFWTMTLGGLWHGASWNFVVWGVYHGLCLIAHREFVGVKDKLTQLRFVFDCKLYRYASIFITFQAVCIGWVFFRVQDTSVAANIVKRMVLLKPVFAPGEGHEFLVLKQSLPVIVPITVTMVVVLLLLNLPLSRLNELRAFQRLPVFFKAAYCAFLVLALVTFLPDNSAPFIYFQF
ncbi:MAG TPA: MBOAT family O-acyltransferase [Candidatus Obscuribacterales bacterium]